MNFQEIAKDILAMTSAIEGAGERGNWPEAARVTELRQPLLMSLMNNVIDELALETLRTVYRTDITVLAMAANDKEQLETAYSESMRSARAMKEYHRIARL